MVCCCCLAADNTRILYFDQAPFAKEAHKADFCKPIPYCCPHCFGMCGDVLALNGNTVGCPAIGFGHVFACVLYCFFPVNLFCGLQEGEAAKAADAINSELAKYRASNGKYDRMM